jgi:hypothetical protein
MKKKQSQKVHFKRRFKERVGYEITDEKFNFIKKNITKDGKHLYNADGNGVYRFSLDGIDLKIVYNITNNSLVTILPS